MASIFTGLAFMHGHIVNKELVLALGAPERRPPAGTVDAPATRGKSSWRFGSWRLTHDASPARPLPSSCGTACVRR